MIKKEMKSLNIIDFLNKIKKYDSLAIKSEFNKNYKELVEDVYKMANVIYSNNLVGEKIFISEKLNYKWIVEYLGSILAGASVVIVESYLKDDLKKQEEIVDIKDLNNRVEIKETDFKNIDREIATIIYTSGTNGKAKPVLLTCENIFYDVIHCTNVLESNILKQGDTTIPILPIFHMFSITVNVLTGLYIGLTLCLIDDLKKLDKSMVENQPAIMVFVPMIAKGILKKIKYIAKSKNIDERIVAKNLFGENLKMIICGGAALGKDTIEQYEKLGIKLLNGYGISECSPVVACAKFDSPSGSVGKVNIDEFCRVKIEDGQIKIKGSIVMKGYGINYNDIVFDSDGYFNTKDLGYIDENGYLYITGRKNNLIILDDGNNVSPEELELLLESIEEVKEALVYNKKLDNSQILFAEIVLEDVFDKIDEDKINQVLDMKIDRINKILPNYKQIRKYKIRDSDFPKNRVGKILRKEVFNG